MSWLPDRTADVQQLYGQRRRDADAHSPSELLEVSLSCPNAEGRLSCRHSSERADSKPLGRAYLPMSGVMAPT